ncbi:MAG TPA: PhoH family protein [Candidatus Kapabacteria bacterium]|nr:PhoH family protein [Candidatus Kapabacteria bacterium]
MEVVERKIKVGPADAVSLFGPNDQFLQLIEQKFDAGIVARGDVVTVRGTPQEAQQIERVFKELTFILGKSGSLSKRDVTTVLDLVTDGDATNISESDLDNIVLIAHHDAIKAKTPTQKEYFQAVKKNDIVFAIGPAGTGKTYLAVAMAVAALKNREVNKIVLARPAVEAGESLGFLPGDLSQKVDPYLRPLYDALQEMLTAEKLRTFVERGTVEVIPLAYMRGRTINNAFVILDEAQNATSMQMKMFLTRLGAGSKAIVTGDETQIDLPRKSESGLIQIQRVLRNVEGIKFVYFNKTDVVRHKLVMDIIDAYDQFHNNTEEGSLFDPATEKPSRPRDN